MENRKRLLPQVLAVLVALIALAYVLALFKITVVKGTTLSRVFENMAAGRAPLRSVNLVPFETVLTYLRYSENMPFLRWFSNIFGNMLVFVPLGLYLPAAIPAMRRFARTLAAVVFVSVTLEALQYLLGTGSTDIDDVWLNATGGSLGYALYVMVARISTRRIPAVAWVLALSVCFGVGGYAVAYREFGVYLGLATFREEVRGDSQIPRRPIEVTMVSPAGGLTLPTSAAALFSHTGSTSSSAMPFKGAVGDEVTVYKIRSWDDGTSKFAVSTTDPTTFRLTPETVYYRQRILRGGREVYVTPGSREDIVAGKTIRVWGSKRDGVLVAAAVCVITANGR